MWRSGSDFKKKKSNYLALACQISGATSGILKACDDVYGKKERGSKGDTPWWNAEGKEAVLRKKDAQKAMFKNSNEENQRRYKSIKYKAVSKAMKEKVEEALTE